MIPTAVPLAAVLQHEIGRGVRVADGRDPRLIHVGDVDRKRLGGEGAVGGGGPDGDVVAGGQFVVECRIDGDHAGVTVDGEPAARVVVQGIGDRVGGGIGVAGTGRDAHRCADDRVFGHRIGRRVDVRDRPLRRIRPRR